MAESSHHTNQDNLKQENHQFPIDDGSSLHRYRTEIPNIIFELDLDPYELTAYLHFKKIAGDRGNCYKSMKNLEIELKMSEKKIREVKEKLSQPFAKLDNKPLISVTKRKISENEWTTDLIKIEDIWPENFLHFMEIKKNSGGSQEKPPLVPDRNHPGSPRADKQYPLKQKPCINKDNVKAAKEIAKTLPYSKQKTGQCLDVVKRFKLSDEQAETFWFLKSQNIDTTENTLCYWAKHHSKEYLEQLILYAKKNKAGSLGAYLTDLIKKGIKVLVDEIERNRQWFMQAMREYSFTAKVNQKYAIMDNGSEIDFNRPHEDFVRHMCMKINLI